MFGALLLPVLRRYDRKETAGCWVAGNCHCGETDGSGLCRSSLVRWQERVGTRTFPLEGNYLKFEY